MHESPLHARCKSLGTAGDSKHRMNECQLRVVLIRFSRKRLGGFMFPSPWEKKLRLRSDRHGSKSGR